MALKLKVTLVRSPIDRTETQKATVRGLGGLYDRLHALGVEKIDVSDVAPMGRAIAHFEALEASLEEAEQQDRRLLALRFARLDQFLYGAAVDAPERLYAYAIRLLLLARLGVPLEVNHAS